MQILDWEYSIPKKASVSMLTHLNLQSNLLFIEVASLRKRDQCLPVVKCGTIPTKKWGRVIEFLPRLHPWETWVLHKPGGGGGVEPAAHVFVILPSTNTHRLDSQPVHYQSTWFCLQADLIIVGSGARSAPGVCGHRHGGFWEYHDTALPVGCWWQAFLELLLRLGALL